MYQVVLTRRAEKDLSRVDEKYKSQITAALFDLKETPYLGKSLKGRFFGCYSLRVWPYRIIYKVHKKQLVVFVIRIGHRQGIYK